MLGAKPICNTLERTDNAHWRERERYWISKYRDAGNDLFNVADGGDGIDFLDEATRRYIGKLHKGRKLKMEHAHAFLIAGQKAAQSPNARAKRIASLTGKPSPLRGKAIHNEDSKRRISLAHIGKPKSEEAKKKLSDANLGHKDSPAVRAKKSMSHMGLPGPNKGKKLSLETRQKQSEALRGKKRSPEFCKKMSDRLAGVPKSKDHRLKMSLRMQGWKPSEEMKAKSLAARVILMRTSKETLHKFPTHSQLE
jgi:hypothetical protein